MTKYQFRDQWQIRLPAWNMPVHSNRGPEHVVISAKSVPWLLTDEQKQRRVCLPGTVEWSQKRQKLAHLSVKKSVLFMPEKSEASQVQHQEHVGHLFCLWGHWSSGICSSKRNCFPAALLGGFATPEQASLLNVWNNGGTRAGSYTLKMRWHTLLCQCSNFWPLGR
jgi:hypothetical protein